MNVHRFAIGQSVTLKGTIGMSLQTGHMFRVTGRMPPRDNSPQYRIRNEEERHERVATESNLEKVDVDPSSAPVGPGGERSKMTMGELLAQASLAPMRERSGRLQGRREITI